MKKFHGSENIIPKAQTKFVMAEAFGGLNVITKEG
jgi:hypothetical protein